MAPQSHKNIGRFDIAMNDAFMMRGVQRVGDLDSQVQQFFEFDALAAEDGFSVWPSRNSMAM